MKVQTAKDLVQYEVWRKKFFTGESYDVLKKKHKAAIKNNDGAEVIELIANQMAFVKIKVHNMFPNTNAKAVYKFIGISSEESFEGKCNCCETKGTHHYMWSEDGVQRSAMTGCFKRLTSHLAKPKVEIYKQVVTEKKVLGKGNPMGKFDANMWIMLAHQQFCIGDFNINRLPVDMDQKFGLEIEDKIYQISINQAQAKMVEIFYKRENWLANNPQY